MALDVVVIGGGQAGLAAGYFLRQQELRFTILEAASELGSSWRSRWDSLVLFTPARYSALPGMPFPGEPDNHPTKDETAHYLTDYVRGFELPVVLGSRVETLRRHNGSYMVQTAQESYTARQVVVATGPFQQPAVPQVSKELDPSVFQTHSTGYRNPHEIPGQRVLVVGGGNSGFQIAEELAGKHLVTLAIGNRNPTLPQKLLGRDLFWWLHKSGLMKVKADSRLGRRMQGRDPVIGTTRRTLKELGVHMRPRLIEAIGTTAQFADTSSMEVDAVVWATGFRSDYSWIEVPGVLDAHGHPCHSRGVTDQPGLYFLGLSWQHTRGSALIGGVGDDAQFLIARISGKDDASGLPKQSEQIAPTAGAPE